MALFHGSKVNLTINVERNKLIGILEDNRQKHEAQYKQAVEGYKKKLIDIAEENLSRAKQGKHPEGFPGRRPQNYLPEYDRALGMLKLTEQDSIGLSAADYARFVKDDWDWKSEFARISSFYSPELAQDFFGDE